MSQKRKRKNGDRTRLGCNSSMIHTKKGRKDSCFNDLGKATSLVHIDSLPFLWAVKKILELAPHLEKLQVIPAMERHLHAKHLELLKKRGVEIIVGHWRPSMAWKTHRNVSPFYEPQRDFFKNLAGKQKEQFEELIALGCKEALMASRYFCLNGEQFIPHRLIARQFGFPEREIVVSARISGLIKYLDPNFNINVGGYPRRVATVLKTKIKKMRSSMVKNNALAALLKKLGLEKLPTNLPVVRLAKFETLILAIRAGLTEDIKAKYSRSYQAVVHNFGLVDGQYRTLKEVGKLMGHISRQRVSQHEKKIFRLLNLRGEMERLPK